MKAALDASFKAILLGNLIDVTLACEDAYSKLVEVVNVAKLMMRIVLATVCSILGS